MFGFGYVPLPSLDGAYVERHGALGPIWKWLLISLSVILYVYPFIYMVEHQLYQQNAPAGYAVDREWAATNHWPLSMPPPDDETKAVYLLEAYHQLHCLRIIRQTFWEAAENRRYTYHDSLEHMEHCFDTLRHTIQCNAESTPLYTFGNFTAGDGQFHRCADWDELRDFATRNTACYRDSVNGIPLGDHFGFCDGGKDGLEGAF